MPSCIVEIPGRNFLIEKRGTLKKMAFSVALMVEAFHEKEAGEKALALLKREEKLKRMTVNPPGDPPLLFIEKVIISNSPAKRSAKEITFRFSEESEAQINFDDLL